MLINKSLDPNELTIPLAKGFIRYLLSLEDGTVVLKEIREGLEGGVWVFVDVNVSQPNKPAYALKNSEPLAIHFFAHDTLPGVFSTRDDFPDTPHQNLVLKGMPYSLCIDSRPWVEIKTTYTSSELLHRIVLWLRRAGRGDLHGADQPLDPNLVTQNLLIIVPEEVFQGTELRNEFVGVPLNDEKTILSVLKIIKGEPPSEKVKNVNTTFIPFEVAPAAMSRLRQAPTTLGLLREEMSVRGVDIYELIRNCITTRVRDNDDWKRIWLLTYPILLIRMPLINPATNRIESAQTLAFALDKTVGAVGEALGVLGSVPEPNSSIPFTPLVIPVDPNLSELDIIGLAVANVIPEFEARIASRMAGREEADIRRAILVGAGSIGSLVAETLVREGRFELTIVDSDVLLPHNLARHALDLFFIGKNKAKALADYLGMVRNDCKPSFHDVNILTESNDNEELAFILHDVQLILDASASVPVGRHLNDMTVDGRRSSFFYSSSGDAAILMVEDCKRKVDLRHLEATLYSEILTNPDIMDLFSGGASLLQYSGRCGDLTLRMAASKAQILSALIARGLGEALDSNDAQLRVWRLKEDGSVSVHSINVLKPIVNDIREWRVRIYSPLVDRLRRIRLEKLPRETGGSLLGIVDIPKKYIDILGALPAPPDSEEKTSEFRRGVVGLREQFEDAVIRTLGQVRYVGEWHSHPSGHSTFPSGIDLSDLAIMTETLSMDGCPGVQLIFGDGRVNIVLGIAKED